jgi:DNA-binding transcriptional MerR regulator
MTGPERASRVTITIAARRTGLAPRTVLRCIRRGLASETLTEADVIGLRRIRRLTDLGVNLAGVEIILDMRHRIEELQAEIARLEALLASFEG